MTLRAAQQFETRILSAEELNFWLAGASAGDRLVYCTGPAMLAGPTLDRLRELLAANRIVTHKRRSGAVLEHYLVLQPASAPIEVTMSAHEDKALEAIFEALLSAARRGRRCPSDFQLARIAELPSRARAQWRVRKLEESGRIAVETVNGPDGPWRIVRIGRRETARPSC